jgi:UDP-N-acetylmuramoylalanine--D-glutamate ligase
MKVGILGCGKTGLSAIDYFNKKGCEIFVKDDKNPLKGYKEITSAKELDLVFVSPGINNNKRQKHPLIIEALSLGKTITSDIEILLDKEKAAKFVGITGTNGKSTATALLGYLLQKIGKEKITLGGNIGIPVLSLEKADLYILELSSFQLDLLKDCKNLTTGLFLNLTPDHMDCYLDLEDYKDSKAKILQAKNNIISADYPILQSLSSGKILFSRIRELDQGLSLIKNQLTLKNLFGFDKIQLKIDSSLLGPYNAENIMGALLAAMTLGYSLEELLAHLSSFQGLPHRLEKVLEKNGCLFINDSKATNSFSTRAALEAFSDKKILLIAGGYCKDEGIIALKDLFPILKKVLLIGESGKNFYEVLIKAGVEAKITETLEGALNSLKDPWKEFDLVLLSPAAASIDQWKNFEARGNFFRSKVLELFS